MVFILWVLWCSQQYYLNKRIDCIILLLQKDNIIKITQMKNYLPSESQYYAKPPRPDSNKYGASPELRLNTNAGTSTNKDILNNKSSKKITYALPAASRAEQCRDKENALHNCRSYANIEIPMDKSVGKASKKRSSSFLNKSQAASYSKNNIYLPQERIKTKSRWETTEYPQNHHLYEETVPVVVVEPPVERMKGYSKTGRYLQNYNSMDVTSEAYQPYIQKKISAGCGTYAEESYPKFGMEPTYKTQKKQNYNSKSSKNIPFYQKIKGYNEPPTFRPNEDQYMHNTYSYADYKVQNQTTSTAPVMKNLNQSLGGYKYKQLIDSYDVNGYGASKVKNGLPSTHLIKSTSNKQETKEPQLDDFLIGACKGQGRFGKVYMAVHKKTGFVCALKKIKKESVTYMLDQFIQEVKIQLYLNHPKLVKIYGYFADSEHFYMLVQYMEEGCLYSLMKKNKKFQQQEAAQKLNQICEGIKEMHDNNIVHRDLKPQNVVLSHGVCKVCDFGWAAICEDRRQTYCGTLDYVCPEIVQGNAYDSSADIWCLGVLAYQMMCGKAPFYDISRQKTIQKIKSCKIDNFPAHLSKKAIKFIQMILKKNPDSRVGIQQLLDSEFLKSGRK